MAQTMSLQEAERMAADLVGKGYTARAYPAKPTGHKVVVTGRHGATGWRYEIGRTADYPQALVDLGSGQLGGSATYTEGATR